MPFEIAGLGTIVVDHQVVLPAYPQADEKTNIVEDRFQVGGPVPTALALLSRWGRRCTFFGNWGDDPWGEMIEADLEREQIDFTHSVCRRGSRSGFAHVWLDGRTGSRTISCLRPHNPLTPAEIDARNFEHVRALHLDGWPAEAALKAAGIVKQNGGLVCLDAGSLKEGMEELIGLVDVLNSPDRFVEQLYGARDIERAGSDLLRRGPKLVTITQAEQGATLFTPETTVKFDAHQVDVVDTTGAGDVFSGAVIHGVLEGWKPEAILKFATAAAALKCTRLGNRDALPSESDVRGLAGI